MSYTNINKSSDYFNTKLYTGNATDNTAITGVGFQPDWLWGKNRTDSTNHYLIDAVRGITKNIKSQSTAAEATDTAILKSFDSDGFTLGDGSLNQSGHTFVTWNWKANGQGSSNTDGTINTTYTSANTTSGMSIIQYSGNGSAGATIGHGLGVAPKCVIIKRTDTTSNWIFGTGARGFDKFSYLNTVDVETTNSGAFNNTAPSSSVITLGSWNDVNNSSGTYIAYAFAEKTGFSKFGSYEGNGSTDGSFVYTGFKPAFVIIKGIDSGGSDNWNIIDNKRLGYNANNNRLFSNSTAAENTTSIADILSNGFKLRVSSTDLNADAKTYIYAAFAAAPLVGTNDIPANAR